MRFIGFIASGLAVGGVMASSGPGYLAVVGPPPIRFQQAAVAVRATLPPLATSETPSDDESTSDSASQDATATAANGSGTDKSETNKVASTPTRKVDLSQVPDSSGFDTNTLPLITAQMLMQYFLEHAGTNQPSGAQPLHFSPAFPAPLSSSATYTSEPKP